MNRDGTAQLSLDIADVVAQPPPKRRRRMAAWEVERAKLKRFQREARKADGAPWLVDEAWPLFRASLEKLRLVRRVEAEAVRCGCSTPYEIPAQPTAGTPGRGVPA